MKEASSTETAANDKTRLAGSLDVKEIYRASDYPNVKLIETGGRVFDVAVLRDTGLVGTTSKLGFEPISVLELQVVVVSLAGGLLNVRDVETGPQCVAFKLETISGDCSAPLILGGYWTK